MSTNDNLPSFPLPLEFPGKIKATDEIEHVKERDLEVIHSCMQGVYNALATNRLMSVDSACKCALTIAKMLEYRRRLLLLPYAAEASNHTQGKVFPLDRE